MHSETLFVARTDRHFSETGNSFAFSVNAFQWIVPILSHLSVFVNEYCSVLVEHFSFFHVKVCCV